MKGWMLLVVASSCLGCSSNTDSSESPSGEELPSSGEESSIELGYCEPLIECARATGSVPVTQLIETYGENGTCWEVEGALPSDCWTECRVALRALRETESDPACDHCVTSEDCAFDVETPYCSTQKVCTSDPCAVEVARYNAWEEACEQNYISELAGCTEENRAIFECQVDCRYDHSEYCYGDTQAFDACFNACGTP